MAIPHHPHGLLGPASRVLRRLRSWPADSQQRACHNAMVATTACAQRRADREDVAGYLAECRKQAAATPPGRTHAKIG